MPVPLPRRRRRRETVRLAAAFLAGQAAMLGAVWLMRDTARPAHAQPPATKAAKPGDAASAPTASAPSAATTGALEGEAILLRRGAGGGSLQLYGAGASGGPSISFVDASGATRMQMTVDGAGRPVILMRDKANKPALALGLENDEPTVAVRGAKGALVRVPLPKEEATAVAPAPSAPSTSAR